MKIVWREGCCGRKGGEIEDHPDDVAKGFIAAGVADAAVEVPMESSFLRRGKTPEDK